MISPMTRNIEAAENKGPQIPFKTMAELDVIHKINFTIKGVAGKNGPPQVGIFRTELPNEPRGSITFARVMSSAFFHTWNVSMENGAETLDLIQELHDMQTNNSGVVTGVAKDQISKIIISLDNLDLRKRKPQETQI